MLNVIKTSDKEVMKDVIDKSMDIINLYPTIFPHLYKQGFKLKSRIEKGNLILQDGVVLTFTQYKVGGKVSRRGTTTRKPKDVIIHQIASNRSVPHGAQKVLDKFIEYCKSLDCGNIILTVREDNEVARKFYEKNGFRMDSTIYWNSKSKGKILGVIYKLELEKNKSSDFFTL